MASLGWTLRCNDTDAERPFLLVRHGTGTASGELPFSGADVGRVALHMLHVDRSAVAISATEGTKP